MWQKAYLRNRLMNHQAILQRIADFDTQYLAEREPVQRAILSKIAIIEAAGWLEVQLDQLYYDRSQKLLSADAQLKKRFEEKVKKKYSFAYEQAIQDILIHLYGTRMLIAIENKLGPRILNNFRTSLANLKKLRDRMAHTHIDLTDSSLIYDSPSTLMPDLTNILEGMKALRTAIMRYR